MNTGQLASADLPGEWRARMLVVLAMLERAATGDLDAADATAHQALTVAGEAGRLRPYGVRRGARGRRGRRAVSGWEALTPTEIKIAALVARGDSTPDIARGMSLSRRTVQTYISHILTKLGAKSRIEIVREALRQGISP